MKRSILSALVLLMGALSLSAVKIDKDFTDEFTGKRVVKTSWERFSGSKCAMRFRLQNDVQWLDFKLVWDDAILITPDDPISFKSISDTIFSFRPLTSYSGQRGGGSTGVMYNSVWGIFASYPATVSDFALNEVKLMRVSTSDGYIDKEISQRDADKIRELATLFLGTVDFANFKKADTIVYFMEHSSGDWRKVKEGKYVDKEPAMLKAIKDWTESSSEGVQRLVRFKHLK